MKVNYEHQIQKLLADVLQLPAKTRAMIAAKLLESLDDDSGIEASIDEAEKRWQAFKQGRMKGIPADKVFPGLKSKLKGNGRP